MKAILNLYFFIVIFGFVWTNEENNNTTKEMEKIGQLIINKILKIDERKTNMTEFWSFIKKEVVTDSLKISFDNFIQFGVCQVCKLLTNRVRESDYLLVNFIIKMCDLGFIFITHLRNGEFCKTVANLYLPSIKYIVNNSKILDEDYACSLLIYDEVCYVNSSALSWGIDIPPRVSPNLTMNSQKKVKSLKILHLSDLHISLEYQENSAADCGYPMCCLKSQPRSVLNEKGAGYWGDYLDCDLPPYTFIDTLQFINHTFEDIDMVYVTGDFVDHRVWNTSIKSNSETINFVFKYLRETFPNVPVLPILGNHETHPTNLVPPPGIKEVSANWLYSLVANLWSQWLPKSSLKTLREHGYYSYIYNSRLKIIALHNAVSYKLNWWLLYDTDYLKTQLNWLRDELLAAEQKGQYVHILAHIPPGNKESIEPWERNYYNLIHRFQDIITGQFVGHTHTDQLKVYLDRNTRYPFSVMFNGASLTSFAKFNPNIKIMNANPENYEIEDIETYTFNLTFANLHRNQSPKWYKLYSMRQSYGLPDLSADSLNHLAKRLFTDNHIFNKYFRYYVRDGDASLQDGYNTKIRRQMCCEVITTESLRPKGENCE